MNPNEIRLIIVDDHPVFRFGLRALLESQPDMQVLAEGENGLEAVELAEQYHPDLILMDINMKGLNGIEATRQILATSPDIKVLMITMLEDETVLTAMQAGARGYLLKGAQGADTLRAIRSVAKGEVMFSPGVAGKIMAHFTRKPAKVTTSPPFPDLTPREQEILSLIARGLTNAAIAERLAISPKTVRNQTSIIFSKLQVVSRSEAIIKAREAGLGKDS